MMQRGRQIIVGNVGPGLGDSMYDGDDLRRRQGQVAGRRLRARRVDGRRHRVRRAQVRSSTSSGRRRSCRSSSAASSSTTTTTSNPQSESWCCDGRRDGALAAHRPRAFEDLHARGHQRHPHEGRARPLPDARLLDVQEDPALGRARLPPRHAHALRDRGLPGEVRDEDGARRALRAEADRARHPRLHHRHELRRAVARGEDGARQGRLDGRHRDVLGRGRHDPAGARPVDQVVLPGHPEPVRVQPAPPDARRRGRVLHRPGLQGRPRRPPDGPEGHRAGGGDALAARGHRPALARPAPRLARARRPVAEDPGDPRGDGLPDPDPAQAGRRARVRRRPHGGQVRAGHHLPRRRGGRHRRRPAPRHGGDRHPADGGDPGGAARARGRRPGRRDRPRGRGRHPQRRRRRQVHRARREGRRDRPLGADGAQLQQGDPGRHRLHGRDGRARRRVLPLPHGPLPGRRSRRRTRSCASGWTSTRRPSASSTSCTR